MVWYPEQLLFCAHHLSKTSLEISQNSSPVVDRKRETTVLPVLRLWINLTWHEKSFFLIISFKSSLSLPVSISPPFSSYMDMCISFHFHFLDKLKPVFHRSNLLSASQAISFFFFNGLSLANVTKNKTPSPSPFGFCFLWRHIFCKSEFSTCSSCAHFKSVKRGGGGNTDTQKNVWILKCL